MVGFSARRTLSLRRVVLEALAVPTPFTGKQNVLVQTGLLNPRVSAIMSEGGVTTAASTAPLLTERCGPNRCRRRRDWTSLVWIELESSGGDRAGYPSKDRGDGDFLPEIAEPIDLRIDHDDVIRSLDENTHDFDRQPAQITSDDGLQNEVVVDVAASQSGDGNIGRYLDQFRVKSFFFEESFVLRYAAAQKRHVRVRNGDGDLLRVSNTQRNKHEYQWQREDSCMGFSVAFHSFLLSFLQQLALNQSLRKQSPGLLQRMHHADRVANFCFNLVNVFQNFILNSQRL